MICPKCQNAEIDTSGTCPICGTNAKEEIPPIILKPEEKESDSGSGTIEKKDTPEVNQEKEERDSGGYSGLIEIDYSSPSEAKTSESPELPQWRLDLAKRLQEIRQKRGAGEPGETVESVSAPPAVQEAAPAGKPQIIAASPSPSSTPHAPRRIQRVLKAVRPQALTEGADRPTARSARHEKPTDLPLFTSVGLTTKSHLKPAEPVAPKKPVPAERELSEIRNYIDNIIAQNAGPGGSADVSQPPLAVRRPSPVLLEDRLILVSRTLSGLVDLMVVLFCAGAFIIVTDMTSGIDIFDGRSLIVYSLLLCAVFLLYSVFFLATANQTVGMMLTDLKVVSSGQKRPRVGQILSRCLSYLPSLLLLGTGLLWGCFDREGRCLHDRVSHTYVVRL